MKVLQSVEAFAAGIAADVVHRNEAVVVVERRVLHAFGHHAPGELLPAHHEREPFVALRFDIARRIEQQDALEKDEETIVERRSAACARTSDRLLEKNAIARGRAVIAHVRSIDAQAGGDFGERGSEVDRREVARVAIGHGHRGEALTQRPHLAGEELLDHLLLFLVADVGE